MLSSHWPLAGLRLETPDLVLRWPSPDDLGALADLAAAGVHDPEVQPFMVPWTDTSPEERARGTLQYHWSRWGAWKPSNWVLTLAVLRDGVVVGTQDIGGRDFAVLREVHTGSWLGQRYQGQGIGTQMRAAVLHLAFDGLSAVEAYTGAYDDNPASLGVTRSLGYEANGTELRAREGQPARMLSYVMTRSRWESRRRTDITIEGLDPCLPFLGASVDRDASATLK